MERQGTDLLGRSGLSMPSADEPPEAMARRISLRLLTVARSVGVVLIVLAGALSEQRTELFWPLAVGVLAGQAANTAIAFSARWERQSEHVVPVLGILALGVLVACSGGVHSRAAGVLVVFPAIGAFVLSRRRLLGAAVLTGLVLLAATLPDVLDGAPQAGRLLATHLSALALAATLGASLATGRALLNARLAAIDRDRRMLLVDALTASSTERRRISAALGAGPLQLLLAARQDLLELVARRDSEALERCATTLDDATGRLRETIVELRDPGPAEAAARAATHDDDPDSTTRAAARILAILRVAAGPPLAATTLLGVPDGLRPVVVPLIAAMAAWQIAALVWVLGDHWRRFPTRATAHVDMVLVGVLIALSGGAQSPVLPVAAILPISFLLVGGQFVQLRIVATLATATLAATVPDVVQGEAHAASATAVAMLTMGWTTVVALLVTVGRKRIELRTQDLQTSRRLRLLESIRAQRAERGAIAAALHDDALQLVLAATQDLHEARDGALSALGYALTNVEEAIRNLREGADELHPAALEHGGLGPALRAIAARAGRRGGYVADVVVVPGAERRHDNLVVVLAQELATNAAKHSRALTLQIGVAPRGEGVMLTVMDDGVGMLPERPQEALGEGHVGLASCRERVEAIGGRLDVRTAVGRGTSIVVHLP